MAFLPVSIGSKGDSNGIALGLKFLLYGHPEQVIASSIEVSKGKYRINQFVDYGTVCFIKRSTRKVQGEIVVALNYKDTRLRASQISQYESSPREPTMMLVLAYARLAKVSMEVLVDDKLRVP